MGLKERIAPFCTCLAPLCESQLSKSWCQTLRQRKVDLEGLGPMLSICRNRQLGIGDSFRRGRIALRNHRLSMGRRRPLS